jgi:hypothetical protein
MKDYGHNLVPNDLTFWIGGAASLRRKMKHVFIVVQMSKKVIETI